MIIKKNRKEVIKKLILKSHHKKNVEIPAITIWLTIYYNI